MLTQSFFQMILTSVMINRQQTAAAGDQNLVNKQYKSHHKGGVFLKPQTEGKFGKATDGTNGHNNTNVRFKCSFVHIYCEFGYINIRF